LLPPVESRLAAEFALLVKFIEDLFSIIEILSLKDD